MLQINNLKYRHNLRFVAKEFSSYRMRRKEENGKTAPIVTLIKIKAYLPFM
jgi:hypothetical protein